MSLWNCKLMDWVEGKLITLTNKLWQKRHPVTPHKPKPAITEGNTKGGNGAVKQNVSSEIVESQERKRRRSRHRNRKPKVNQEAK